MGRRSLTDAGASSFRGAPTQTKKECCVRDKRAAMSDVVTSACVWASVAEPSGGEDGRPATGSRRRARRGGGTARQREALAWRRARREGLSSLGGDGRRRVLLERVGAVVEFSAIGASLCGTAKPSVNVLGQGTQRIVQVQPLAERRQQLLRVTREGTARGRACGCGAEHADRTAAAG